MRKKMNQSSHKRYSPSIQDPLLLLEGPGDGFGADLRFFDVRWMALPSPGPVGEKPLPGEKPLREKPLGGKPVGERPLCMTNA